MATVLLGLCTVTNTRSKYYRAGARMEAKSNSRLSSTATAGLGHGHKHKDEASELVSDGGGHFFFKCCLKFQTLEPRRAWPKSTEQHRKLFKTCFLSLNSLKSQILAVKICPESHYKLFKGWGQSAKLQQLVDHFPSDQ